MFKFFLKLILFLVIVSVPYVYFQYKLMLKNDAFYFKSTHKANTLIIGGSRALKGLSPAVLKKELQLQGDVLNFAFTAVLSPYGELYYNLIKRKIESKNNIPNLFLLSVTPGNIMDFTAAEVPRESSFKFYQMYFVNTDPNFEYVMRHPRQGKALLTALIYETKQPRSGVEIYPDGYNATFLPKNYMQKNKGNRTRLLKYDLQKSKTRESYFEKTVDYLADLGEVYLIRFPVSLQMIKEENSVYPLFDDYMNRISQSNEKVHYLNFTSSKVEPEFTFSDGDHHLEGKSALLFTTIVADSIKSYQ